MSAKEYLRQYKRLGEELRQLELDIKELESIAESITAPTDGDGIRAGVSDRVGNIAAKLCDMHTDAIVKRGELTIKRAEIRDTIFKIGGKTEARILFDRYIEGMTWEEIAVDVGKTYKWVCVLHGRALQEVDVLIG